MILLRKEIMSRFVKQAILDEVAIKAEDLHHRKQYTPEEIKRTTDLALQLGDTEVHAATQ